jgi:hypothetical protein
MIYLRETVKTTFYTPIKEDDILECIFSNAYRTYVYAELKSEQHYCGEQTSSIDKSKIFSAFDVLLRKFMLENEICKYNIKSMSYEG